jgi:REP element-mobilizing transposase RayT
MQTADAHAGASLPAIMQWFKTMTTNAYIKGVRQHGWTPFRGKLWQRSYYEHIVRDRRDLDRIRIYIQQNPARWYFDREHPTQRD